METIRPTSKEEALAAITHAYRAWNNWYDVNPDLSEDDKDQYLNTYFKYGKELGAAELEMLRATILGTPDNDGKQALLNIYFEDARKKPLEVLLTELPGLINIKNEFGLQDPNSFRDNY